MKSRLVSDYPEYFQRDEVKSDLQKFVHLDSTIVKNSSPALFELYLTYIKQRDSVEFERQLKAAATQLHIEVGSLRLLFRLAGLFLDAFRPGNDAENDKIEDIADDLITLGDLDVQARQSFITWLDGLKAYSGGSAKVNYYQRVEDFAKAASPYYEDVVGVVNFRPVFDIDYEDDLAPVASYSPKCIGIVPVALISLRVDEGPRSTFYFQADQLALEKMIRNLQAIQKEMQIGAEYLKLSSDGAQK